MRSNYEVGTGRSAGGAYLASLDDKTTDKSMKKKDEQLIPLEKSNRVIYLDRRGAEKEYKPVASVFFGVLGILCLIYFGYQLFFVHTGSNFFVTWGAMAVGCGVLSFFLAHRSWVERIPKWLRWIFRLIFGLCVILFLIIEGLIVSEFNAVPDSGADVCIVLGAQMKESGPSDVLKRRLDKAIIYLQENPDTLVIVSGGQGSNEPVSEAQGMRDYLILKGIAPERIMMEDTSTSTWENLSYSSELIDKSSDSVVIVTNNFHVFRAVCTAKKQGYSMVQGLASSTHRSNLLNNMMREFFGVIKDFLVGNI